jgi:Beta-galactosidase C-terminal domain
VWREDVALMKQVGSPGTDQPAVAILLDYVSLWATEPPGHPSVARVEAVRRRRRRRLRHRDGRTYLFLINHLTRDVTIPATGTDPVTGTQHHGSALLPAAGVLILREPRPAPPGAEQAAEDPVAIDGTDAGRIPVTT